MNLRGDKEIAQLVVYNSRRKGVRDADLADACGFTVEQMYGRLGHKLLMLARSSWFELQPAKKKDAQGEARPVIVFTLSGVVMIAAWLGTQRALEFATEILPMLKMRQRASKYQQRRPSRLDDPAREEKYQRAQARLRARVNKMPGS